ncbi:hypothetical protein GCM10009839_41290 [Catenulispora yoronensis]|uniref:Uncharacterized protein n=1 Tax=Catenulispora yoronensis TaxID=450799 RepID=A0ABN2UGW9_9ACTN
MPEIDVLTQVLPPIGAAAAAYGAAVLTKAEDAAATETVRLGQRLLARIRHRGASADGVQRAVLTLATADADELADARAALRLELRRLLASDQELRDDLAASLPPATSSSSASSVGDRNIVVGGDNTGIATVGDGNINIQSR